MWVHITTAMLRLGAHLTGLHAASFLERPTSAHTAEGCVFCTAVEAELAARQRRGPRLTVPEVLARVTSSRGQRHLLPRG